MDAGADVLKMLPFLFAAFMVTEALEHYSAEFTGKILGKAKSAGPVTGAILGCVPQCGFSVMAANLYAGGIISVGTLLSVFIATSDEAVLILMGNPGQGGKILKLLAVKILIGVIAGYGTDFFLWRTLSPMKKKGELQVKKYGCQDDEGIVVPAFFHTVKILLYLFLFTAVLGLCMEIIGMESLSKYLLHDTWFQPVVTALIGLIPNCVSSVILTELYLNGVISFASVMAGLCTGAGVGLAVLFKMNQDKKDSMKILLLLYGTGVLAGMLIQIAG